MDYSRHSPRAKEESGIATEQHQGTKATSNDLKTVNQSSFGRLAMYKGRETDIMMIPIGLP